MTFIGDDNWRSEYPIVMCKNGIMYEENGNYIRDYWMTERTCKVCNRPFVRTEYPPIFRNNLDALLGKDVCLGCGYVFLEAYFSKEYVRFLESLR